MEIDDDGVMVIIVGDDNEGEPASYLNEETGNIVVKTEPLDEDSMPVEDLFETVEKYGTEIKQEVEYEYEYLEDEMGLETTNATGEDTFLYAEDVNDPSYILPDYKNLSDNYDSDEAPRSKKKKKLKIESYVEDLRERHPELVTEDEVVDKLASIMKETVPPLPPVNFCKKISDKDFECAICFFHSKTVTAASRHFQDKHGEKYLMCFACGYRYRCTVNLYKHEKRCLAPDAEIVLKARARAVNRRGRWRPYMLPKQPKYKKSDRRFHCAECTASFSSQVGLTAHQNMHRGIRPYQCDTCGAAYCSKSAMRRHTRKHNDDVRFQCDNCGVSFKVKSSLISHLNTHLLERKYPCTVEGCKARYAQKSALRLHIDRDHLNLPSPCACQLCPKRYARMSMLKIHMKRHHGMILMTRTMFFKKLPQLSEMQVQRAKLYLKSEAPLVVQETVQ